MTAERIGFVSTRFAGTDGVSLEAAKWAEVLEKDGHQCFWFAGELDRNVERSYLVPEAHFKHAMVQHITNSAFGVSRRDPETTETIHSLRAVLKKELYAFLHKFNIDLLVIQNALTIPMNIPLGLAIAETISETGIPVISHHHDFYWERKRFSVNAIGEFMPMAFPADLPSIRHAVINSLARRDLAHRRGIAATLIPNVLDFANPLRVKPSEIKRFRQSIGLKPDDRMVLQPTRLIKRKGIEHMLDLVGALGDPSCKLVISHEDSDEGIEYSRYLQTMAKERGIDLRMVKQSVASPWCETGNDNDNQFSLWTVYAAADLVGFCSLYEGFGNGLLEAIYFKKPVVINRYDIFINDIEPLGFEFITMDGHLTPEVVAAARDVLSGNGDMNVAVEKNYAIAGRYFSYEVLHRRLKAMIEDLHDSGLPGKTLCKDSREPEQFEDRPMRLAM